LDLSAIAKAVTEKTKAIFLTAPNNPTGTVFKREAFYALVKKTAGKTLLIVDEAYVDFMEDKAYPDMLDEIKMGRNVIVLRTFSKYYGLAGIRLGYCAAKKEIIAPMYKTKMPFNVNRLAQAAAIAALGDKAFLKNTYRNNLEGKKYLYAELDKLGLEYKKTEANFIFITLKQPADAIFTRLMKLGVIIRPLTSFGFPDSIRVSIGLPEQNNKFIEALKKLL
jgi:histidinol-phosphate aminotransferase